MFNFIYKYISVAIELRTDTRLFQTDTDTQYYKIL